MSQTIVTLRFGSHLYGTATPASDTDFKAVFIPNGRDILLGRVQQTVNRKTKVDITAKNSADDVDHEAFALQKYLHLVAEGQTVALDMLFAPEWALTEPASDLWRLIQANRRRLVSRRCQAFIGYCRQQANKYGIKGSRMAAARAAADLFGASLGQGGTQRRVSEVLDDISGRLLPLEHVALVDQTLANGMAIKHLEVCNRKVPLTATVKTAHDVFRRLFDEYGERSRRAEQNDGVDWKALSHAVRVGRQAIELLSTGAVTFPRPEAAHLLDVKLGRLPYKPVAEEIEGLLEQVEATAAASTLPDGPDEAFIEALVMEAHREAVARSLDRGGAR